MYNSSLIDEYGKPLVPLDDDKLNGVKPLRIQDQIATDENGRRRFHGAFTGGFSAGYWNTVGSQEGWKPQHFKSSRNIKAAPLGQKPLDFMDDEDLEEFGNAPLSLQNRDDDPTIITVDEINLKRVLNLDESKIMAATAPEREAKNAEKEKRRAAAYNKRKLYVLEKYGCDTGSASNVWHSVTEEDISAAFEPTNTTEPEPEIPALNDFVATEEVTLKFGFGDYTPLSTEEPANVQPIVKKAAEVPTKKPNALSIRGHAFGVGALEEDDDDIYAREDMSRYDFSLEDKRKKKQRVIKMLVQDEEGVAKEKDEKKTEEDETSNDDEKTKTADKDELVIKTSYQIYKEEVGKPNFLKPRVLGERKSRFGPAPKETENLQKSQDSATINTEQPQVAETSLTTTIINPFKQNNTAQEKSRSSYEEDKKQKLLELISAKSSNFVRTGEVINTSDDSLTKEKEIEVRETKDVNKKIDFPAAISSFKPFAYDELKQMRYDQFVKANVCSEREIREFLATIQPKHMSEWDREMEMKEFIQSRKLYRPLDGIMANRFVTETTPGGTVAKIEPIATAAPKEEPEQAKEKIVTIVRTNASWRPSAQLCKRFNIPEPLTELVADKKSKLMKKPQLSVFDYLEGSVHKKSDFVTPVIIPKHNPNPKEIRKSALDARNQSEKLEMRDNEQTPAKRPSRWNVEHRDEIKKTKPQDKNQSVPTEAAPGTSAPERLTFIPKAARGVDKEPTPAATEKRELFQAIFSDNEDDEEDKRQKPSETAATANKTEALNLPPRLSTQSDAASANLLRNLSPPRGIFAALFSAGEKETKEEEQGKTSNDYEPLRKVQRIAENKSDEMLPDNSYGPAIPKSLAPKPGATDAIATSRNTIEQTLVEQRISIRGVEIIEKWVEKDDASSGNDESDSSSDSSIERSHQSKHKSSKKSKKAKKSKKKSKKKERAKHKSAKRKTH